MIELDFVPDVIINFTFDLQGRYFLHIWGEDKIYEYYKYFILSLMDNKSGFFFAQKGLGKYKIISGSINDQSE